MGLSEAVAAAPLLPPWDHSLFKGSVLSDYEQRVIAFGISQYMHNVTGIPNCRPTLAAPSICAMCGSAVRLVLQAAESKIIDAVLTRQARALGRPRIDLHPRGDFDD